MRGVARSMRGQWRPALRAVLALAFAVLIAADASAQNPGEVTEFAKTRHTKPLDDADRAATDAVSEHTKSNVSEHAKTGYKPFSAPLDPGQVANPFDDTVVVRIAPTQRPEIPKDVRPVKRTIVAKAPPGWRTSLKRTDTPPAGWDASVDRAPASPDEDPVAPPNAQPPTALASLGPETEYAKPISRRLNPTGRAINMPVPIKDGEQQLGEVNIQINADDSIVIHKASLVEKLTPVLDQPALAKLQATPEQAGQVAMADLRAAGFTVAFDAGMQELSFNARADERPVGDLTMKPRRQIVSSNLVQPALFSGYLNVIGGVDHLWNPNRQNAVFVSGSTQAADTSGHLNLQSAVSFYNIVFENEATWDGDIDTFTCPTGAKCIFDHAAGFKRLRSRLVFDMPEQLLRLQIGDTAGLTTSIQRSADLLGVSLEHSYRKLAPGENIRPTGRSSFRIDQPAEVDVVINGAIVQHYRLRAGNYNLSDLPLVAGANQVELVVTDDTGARRVLAFSTFGGGNLLAAGKTEWALSGGIPSYIRDNEIRYAENEWMGTGFLRYGLSDQVTTEMQAQGDNYIRMGGGGIFTATPLGVFGFSGAYSTSDLGAGYAGDATWELINFRGALGTWWDTRETLRLAAEYRSTHFRTPGELLTTANGILYPQFNYWLRLTGSYSFPIALGVTTTFAARYQFADDKQLELSPYTLKGDRYGADVTLSSPLGGSASASVTLGVSNESYLHYFENPNASNNPDYRVMFRIYVRPTEKTRLAANYDSLNRTTYVSAGQIEGRGLDRWEANVDVQADGLTERAQANGSVAYYGNRGEVRVSHASGFDGVTYNGFNASPTDQRTSVRVGAGLAFADGHFAVGAPIRGNGFAIVYPHESIAGKEITVGNSGDVRARSGPLGPALVPDLPAYVPSTITVDVADLPIGYSLGTGAFDTFAPYRAGYALQVGSAYSVAAFGTLLSATGEPVALLTGIAFPADNPSKQVAIFTNKLGRFGAEGLAPGSWVIEIAAEGGPTRYEFVVPKGTDGLFRAGVLRPAGQDGWGAYVSANR